MKKHFLILMLMALLPMAGFALTLDGSKFSAANIDYGTAALPDVVADGYALNTDYTVDATHFYTSNTGAGETAVANLKTANNGQYFIKVLGAGGYDGQTIYVDFWVKGIPVTIDFGDVSKTYGEADADYPITYALTKKGADWNPTDDEKADLGLTVNRAAGENVVVGGYAYSFDWTNKNFTVTRAAGDVSVYTIEAKDISATATITAWQGDVTYTGKDIIGVYTVLDKAEGGVTLTAGVNGGTGDYYVSAAHNAGDYTPTITFQNNYTGSINVAAEKKFTVNPAPIVVGVEDLEADYDGATNFKNQTTAAAGKFTYSGIVGDDVANAATIKTAFTAPTSVLAKKDAIDAGEYELTISGGAAGGNYVFATYMPGKLTVNKAALALKAADAEKAIDDADPAFELVNTYAPLVITGVTYTREPGETAGEYAITPVLDAVVVKASDAADAKNVTANYNITVAAEKGKLTIGKTKIYVTIKDAEKFYGAADPEFTYTVKGLKEGDALAPFTITREAGERPYSYSMTATVANPNEARYSEVVVANGIFTIKKAQLELTFTAAQSVKLNPTAEEKAAALKKSLITVAGINNSDVAADLYGLSYEAGVDFTTSNTDDDGVVITLDAATKKLLTENATDYFAKDLYEIVTAKDADGNVTATAATTNCKLIVGEGTAAALAFTTSADATDYNKIKAHAGETQDVTVTLNRRNAREIPAGTAHPWTAETWNTMVLPFEVTVAELSAQLGYAIVNLVNPAKTTEGNVVFKLEMKKIPANTPFCVKTDANVADAKVLTFRSKLIVDGGEYPSVDAGSGYKFVGAYKDLTIDKTKPNFSFLRGNTEKWAQLGETSTNTWTVVPFDAYVDLTGAANAREVIFTFEEIDGTKTAIKAVEAGLIENSSVKTGWYTIGGMKLQGAPTQKGIYINNGKKVIIK